MPMPRLAAMALALLTPASAFAQGVPAASAPTPPPAASTAPRAEPPVQHAVRLLPGERLVLDGTLAHPAWSRAPAQAGFVSVQPQPGEAPPRRTEVRVLFDEQALWIGVKAFEPRPDELRDVPVRFDGVNRTQDFVVAYVDAVGSRRAAQFFRVNAAGSTADGLHTAADDNEDFTPDFDWDAAVARDADGWTAVLRLPFASLRYPPASEAAGAAAPWRFMVARRLPREQFHLFASVPIPRELPSFIHNLQRLEGVQLPAEPSFLIVRPSLTARHTREQAPGAPDRRGSELEASVDIKWRPRAEWVLDATLNPDFAQVALDEPQLAGNTRFALFLAEKRPFFFESADLLRSPTDALYTRTHTAPRWGLRSTWRSERFAGTAYAIDDRGGGLVLLPGAYGTGVAEQPASKALAARGLWEGGGGVQWGAVAAARRYAGGAGENLVAGPDVFVPLPAGWKLRGQWLGSRTTALAGGEGLAAGPPRGGDRLFVRAERQGNLAEAAVELDTIDGDFRHDGGFVAQAGVQKLAGFVSTGWPRVGPFNELWINTEAVAQRDRASGDVVHQVLRPGLWATGARNFEGWIEWHAVDRRRFSPGGPLVEQHFVHFGTVFTPATWFPLLDLNLSVGRLADAGLEPSRRGVQWYLAAKLRPLRRLEIEPTVNGLLLHGDEAPAFREQTMQWLAVWHVDGRRTLRAIWQETSFDRGTNGSLTWTHRTGPGAVLYVGAAASRRLGGAGTEREQEVFVKWQFDAGGLWRRFAPGAQDPPRQGSARLPGPAHAGSIRPVPGRG